MSTDLDQELAAMGSILSALQSLEPEARTRVLSYVFDRLKLEARDSPAPLPASTGASSDDSISAVGQKWLRRNGIDPITLRAIFAIDTGAPDVIASSVPGDSTRQKLRNVVLLLGASQYLASGEARFSDLTLREACKHYDAYDMSNHTAYMKSIAAEVSGTKESGYTLTARGLVAAGQLLKSMAIE